MVRDIREGHVMRYIDRGTRGKWGRKEICGKDAERMKKRYADGVATILADRTLLEQPIGEIVGTDRKRLDAIAAISADPDFCFAYVKYNLEHGCMGVYTRFKAVMKRDDRIITWFLDELEKLMQPTVHIAKGMRTEIKRTGADIPSVVDRAVYRALSTYDNGDPGSPKLL